MNSLYSFLLLSALLATVISSSTTTPRTRTQSTLRRSQSQRQAAPTPEQIRRRRLVEDVTCTLFVQDTMFKPNPERPNGYSKDSWVCEFSAEESERLGVEFVELADNYHPYLTGAKSGRSVLSIEQAIIDMDYVRMYLPSGAEARVATPKDYYNRKLVASRGDLPTLMVRVVDSKGLGPQSSIDQLVNDVFEDKSCLKTQMGACSHNKLRIQPYQDDIVSNGVHELKVNVDAKAVDRGAFEQAMLTAFKSIFGDISDPKFGLVMFCIPEEADPNFSAIGWVNNKVSIYSGSECHKVSVQMHEVGHNINLEHSGEGDDEYADGTGMMGYSYKHDDQQMCYNAAKSWQLGWYDDQTRSNNPKKNSAAVQNYVLNGVNDYNLNSEALVVLRLEQPSSGSDYYIGYNRKNGINADVVEDGDKVTIIRKDSKPNSFGFSWKVASLTPGMSYKIENFDNEGTLQVRFRSVTNGGRDAEIEVFDLDQCTPELCPTLEVPCETYTIQVKTDNYPEDTSWKLVANDDSGMGFEDASNLRLKNHLYETKTCLPYDTDVKFTINDVFGDGVCCHQGDGYYRILDPLGNEIASGAEGYKTAEHTFKTESNPSPPTTAPPTVTPTRFPTPPPVPNPTAAPVPPPTAAPVLPPTAAPVPPPTAAPVPPVPDTACVKSEKYTISITTDNYPGDNSWSILKGEEEVFVSTPMTEANRKYKTMVCLEYDTSYKFVLIDSHTDGICCGQGNGSYLIRDSQNNIVVQSDENVNENFHVKEFDIQTGPSPAISLDESNDIDETPNTPNIPNKPNKPNRKCKDKKGKFKLSKKSRKKFSCKKIAKKKKCNQLYQGKEVWWVCPKACKKCKQINK